MDLTQQIAPTYEEYRKRKCKWCAKGSRASVNDGTVHKVYPMNASSGAFRDPSVTGRFSEYFGCTAPDRDTYEAELVARLVEAEKNTERLPSVMVE